MNPRFVAMERERRRQRQISLAPPDWQDELARMEGERSDDPWELPECYDRGARWTRAAKFVGEIVLVLLIVALGWFAIVAFG